MKESLSAKMRRMALSGHGNAEAAIAAAKKNGNVAFVAMAGTPFAMRYMSCCRDHIGARISDGQKVEVLADFEARSEHGMSAHA